MESKRHQKLYEHYTNYFGQEPKFGLKLKKNVLPEAFKSSKIVKCYISEHKYISIFQVMPITRELLSKKLKKGTNGVYWLMEYFYTHDDDYHLTAFKPFRRCDTQSQTVSNYKFRGQIALFALKTPPIFVYKIKTLNLFRLSVFVVRIAVLRGYSFT